MLHLILVLLLGALNLGMQAQSAKQCKSNASSSKKSQQVLARYPKEWDVAVPKGTKLDAIRRQMEKEAHILPERDLEDQSPLPAWFRVYLRKANPDLPTSGTYQYPRTAMRVLQHLLSNPNSTEMPKVKK